MMFSKNALVSVAIFLITTASSLCDACLTQTGAYGECVNIKKCRPVMRLLRSRPPLKVYNDLRNAHCGFEGDDPKICCEIQRNFPTRFKPSDSLYSSPTTTSKPTSVISHPNLKLLDHEICGPVTAEPKIYGGSATKIFEFPWMALLAYSTGQKDDKPDFRCGATIINRNYVMTAAHCVTNLPENLKFIGVRVGEHNLAKERDCEIYDNGAAYICAEKYQDFTVEKVYAHPDYSPTTLQNDIALIRLNSSMNFKPASVRPICLPLSNSNPIRSGLVTGWGSTEDGSPSSDILLKVRLPVLPNDSCVRAYRDQPFVKLWHKQLCAGGIKSKDSCTGDSGGPLQTVGLYNGVPRMIQHGIVSFGRRNCAIVGSPGVYTTVDYYVTWILDTMEA